MAIVSFDGFEHGVLSTSGLNSELTNAVSADIQTTYVKSGSRALRLTTTTATRAAKWAISSGNIYVASFQFNTLTTPSNARTIMHFGQGNTYMGMIRIDASRRLYTAIWNNTTTINGTVSAALLAGEWYQIDVKVDFSTANWTVDGRVNDVALSQVTDSTIGSAQNLDNYVLGERTTTWTSDLVFDDVVIANSAADYPIANYYVKGYALNSVGTHNLDAATSSYFFDDTATALTTSENTSYQKIDETPMDSTTDYVYVAPGAGSAPTIPTTAANTLLSQTTSSASTTHTFPSLTTLAPAAGDLIIAICVAYEGDTTPQFSSWGASLTEILDDSTTGTGNGAIGVAYKIASGSETGTFNVTSVESWKSVQFLMRIPAATWHGTTIPEIQAATRAAGASADPASFNPANWGTENTLWIAVGAHTETSTTGSPPTLTASPTNFSGDLIVARAADAVGDITAGVGFRQQGAETQDVGTWSGTNLTRGNGLATVIAVRPAVSEPTNTWYLEYGITDSSEGVDPTQVRAIFAGMLSTGSSGGKISAKIREGGSDAAIATDIDHASSSALNYRQSYHSTKPSGGAWTDTTFDGTTFRWGYTNDATPNSRLHSAYVEGLFPVNSLPPTAYLPQGQGADR